MTQPPATLLDALLAYLATACELSAGTDLFGAQFGENPILSTCVTQTGGPSRPWAPMGTVNFQVLTRGREIATTRARAIALHDAMLDDQRFPLRNVTLAGPWRALSIDIIQPPADIGRSEGGLHQTVFNVSVLASRAAS